MKLSSLRARSAATALILSVAVLGAACAETDDVSSAGQEQSTETETEAATPDAEGETSSEAAGSKTGRVGAKYAANVFTLVGTDETEDGRIVAITDGSVDVRTSDTLSYDGEVIDFTDPRIAEVLGEEAYAVLESNLEGGQVLLIETYSVQ
jgi:hypothetical protein